MWPLKDCSLSRKNTFEDPAAFVNGVVIRNAATKQYIWNDVS